MELTETVEIDNIEVRVFEPPKMDYWDKLRPMTRMVISQDSGSIQTATARNTTTEDMHAWLVARTDPFGDAPADIEELALGRSDSATSETDTELNDEVDRAPITSTNREGDTLRTKTFIDKDVGNVDTSAGESISEIGLYAGPYFLNHAVLSNDIDKTSNKTAIIDVLITYGAV